MDQISTRLPDYLQLQELDRGCFLSRQSYVSVIDLVVKELFDYRLATLRYYFDFQTGQYQPLMASQDFRYNRVYFVQSNFELALDFKAMSK